MTFGQLLDIFEKNNVPKDAKLLSDSGWECGATQMNGIHYNAEKNIVIFTQGNESFGFDGYDDGFVTIYKEEWGER